MAGIFCSINMALEMGRGGMCFACSQSLLLFKLKDAEILQTDPTQFLPFLWIVDNLILQTQGQFKSEFLKFRLKSEFFWAFPGIWGFNHSTLIFGGSFQHGHSHCSLHIHTGGCSCQHCQSSPISWGFLSIWDAPAIPRGHLLALKSWTGVKVKTASGKDPQSCWGAVLSLFVSGKGIFSWCSLKPNGGQVFSLPEMLRFWKKLAKSKNLHFRATLLESPRFAAKLCYTSQSELHFMTEPLLEPKAWSSQFWEGQNETLQQFQSLVAISFSPSQKLGRK